MADGGQTRLAQDGVVGGMTHVIGAGLAGLSTALCLSEAGHRVTVWESAGHAGGRVRSFHDAVLDRMIDNGSHLILTGNDGVQRFMARSGAPNGLVAADHAAFPMVDLEAEGDRRHFTIQLDEGRLQRWLFDPARRIPGMGALDLLAGWRLAFAGPETTVAQAVRDRGPAWRAFWEPLTLGILNTKPEAASAALLWRVMAETFLKGARPSRPMFAPDGLASALVDPAVARLRAGGVAVNLNTMVKDVERVGDRATALRLGGERVALSPDDRVVLALPPSRLTRLMPDLAPPADDAAILNAHFRVDEPAALADVPPLVGIIGGMAQWTFVRGDVISVTVSAAHQIGALDRPRAEVASILWREVAAALHLKSEPAASRIIVEKRATFDQSPDGVARRLTATTSMPNVFLAGDATQTGLPATIEGAVRSGETAAKLVMASLSSDSATMPTGRKVTTAEA